MLHLLRLPWPGCLPLLRWLPGFSGCVLLFTLASPAVFAQPSQTQQLVTLEAFFAQIMQHHPVARQAALLPEQARQEIRMARGSFDPNLSSSYYAKEFGERAYFSLWDNLLKVPVWYGTDLKLGYERNEGGFLNPEDATPSNGLSYIGITVPLGQGWLIDERRSILRQAQLLPTLAQADQLKLLNKLLLQAAKDYLDWYYHYQRQQLFTEGISLATVRLQAVRERVKQGDLAAIDTVEAAMEVQNREVQRLQAAVDAQNYRLIVSNYLWRENDQPAELTPQAIPALTPAELSVLPASQLPALLQAAQTNHPDLVKLEAKQQQLAIERRFAADKLKPKLNLDYNLLEKGRGFNGETFTRPHLETNYKIGVKFSYPLFLRQERGKLQTTRLKQEQNRLEQQQTTREVLTGVQTAYNELQALETQLRLQEQLVASAQVLQQGEQARFEGGESSLFMINSREQSLLSQQVKLYELRTKYAKARTTLQWAAGRVGE